MQANKGTKSPTVSDRKASGIFIACVLFILLVLFLSSFNPDRVGAANDGPYGGESAAYGKLPRQFLGTWQDLNTVGVSLGSRTVNLTGLVRWWLGPLGFSKFYAPFV